MAGLGMKTGKVVSKSGFIAPPLHNIISTTMTAHACFSAIIYIWTERESTATVTASSAMRALKWSPDVRPAVVPPYLES